MMRTNPTFDNTLLVVRSPTPVGTKGSMYFRGDYICDTLEPVICDGAKYHGLLPAIYPLFITYSPRFRCLLPLIECSGRSGIRIHAGNYARQSKGCILVGRFIGSSLRDSKLTLSKVVNLIKKHCIKFITIQYG